MKLENLNWVKLTKQTRNEDAGRSGEIHMEIRRETEGKQHRMTEGTNADEPATTKTEDTT